ncbi:hypothetical protein DFH11DRAFT_97286 [Phellopilus nigrolimitatus]|nr:hypothetical protein DFH11DRAFT_97286 [Phellopilus nigrolimitatus]
MIIGCFEIKLLYLIFMCMLSSTRVYCNTAIKSQQRAQYKTQRKASSLLIPGNFSDPASATEICHHIPQQLPVMPLWSGSFSYKFDANPKPQYQFYWNMTRVFKLTCIAPGVARITFHVVHPEENNQQNILDRIDPARLHPPNAANIFQLFIMENQPGQDFQLVHVEPEDVGDVYHIMWTEDYTMRVEGVHNSLMLYQQHQSAKSTR